MKKLITLLLLLLLSVVGCTHSIMVGECSKVEGQDKNVCKTLKPWE